MKIKFFHNPRCSKSRSALVALQEAEIEFEIVNYLSGGLKVEDLYAVMNKSGLSAQNIMRTKEKVYQDRGLKNVDDTNILVQEIINFPILLERPIVLSASIAMIIRTEETIKTAINALKNE